MRHLLLIVPLGFLAGCPKAEDDTSHVLTAEDCIPSTGDNCSCDPQCLTQEEIDAIGEHCDLGCFDPTWTCTVDAGSCVVVTE